MIEDGESMYSGKGKKVFITFFSVLIFTLFFALLSSNGLILGNDPAVHVLKANDILESGRISFSEIAWYPPLYRVLLAEYILFTGASNFESVLFLVKMLTSLFDWLLIFSVYLLGTRLVCEEAGVIASSLMLLCFPLYEINFWGGYSSLLSIIYMCLLIFYLPTKREGFAYRLIAFVVAFSLVLTHQFATFLVVTVLVFYALVLLFVFRRSFTLTFILTVLGAVAAFILWYVPAILPYINVFISHLFFGEKTYLNLTWRVTLEVFIMSFGFIIAFAFLGILLTFYSNKRRKELEFYTLLCLGFLVPLFFSQSYFLGFLLPYDRFVYYLMPPAAAFAAAVTYLAVKYTASYAMNVNWKIQKYRLKAIALILFAVLLFASRFPVLTGKICEAIDYYSYLNPQSYDAGAWLKTAYAHEANMVVSEKPGLFLEIISGKTAIMETSPLVRREAVAETVLNFAYEVEHAVTLFRVYESPMPYELDQYNVLVHGVWRRATFLFDEETTISYNKGGKTFSTKIADLERKIYWVEQGEGKKLQIQYSFGNEFVLTETIEAKNNRIPVYVCWTFSPKLVGIENLQLNLSMHFDLYRSFEKAYIPGILRWQSPWEQPSFIEGNRKWAIVNFHPKNLPKKQVAFYDPLNGILVAFNFEDTPEWGSVGVLATNQIDALRLRYTIGNISDTASISYSIIAFSEESFQKVDLNQIEESFNMEVQENFVVQFRDYKTHIKEKNIRFLVFEKEKFRKEFLNYDFLQLLYSNDRYVVCKVEIGVDG